MTPGVRHSGWSCGSGSGSVTSRAARIRPRGGVPDQGVGVRDRSAGHVDQQGAVGHGREEGVVDEVAGGVAERHPDDHDVVLRQQGVQLRDAVDVAALVVPRLAGHPCHGGFERQEPVLDRLAHAAVADDQHAPVREAGGGPGLPVTLLLVLQQPRELALAGQDQGKGQFGGGGFVDAGGVGEHPARRERLRDAVVPDRLALHRARCPPTPGCAGSPCCPCRAGPRCRSAAGAVPRSGPIRGR